MYMSSCHVHHATLILVGDENQMWSPSTETTTYSKAGVQPKKTNESGTVVGKPFRILYQEPKTLLIAVCSTLLPWDPEQNTAKPAGPAEYDPQLP